jgi:hypothetical protein
VSGLDDRQRKAFSRLISLARAALSDDAAKTLRGIYGILPDGEVQSEGRLARDPALRARRRTLEAVLAHLRAEGLSTGGAVERLTREVAFTHLNRIVAIRVADALGVLAPSLRDGIQSTGFRQWVSDLAPLLSTADDTGGYWTFLGQCADELAADAPALFDPRNPLLALRPSKAALEAVVTLLSDPENADLWDADDTFGWFYQFFNTREERQEMRKSSAPRDSRELAVRNQFFTPAYVVRFLVQNALGRRIVDADPSTPLLDQLPLLIDPPIQRGAPLDLAEVKVLDPACGSGHFLIGCYDVLEAAWDLAGVPPEEAAARIIPCLWGIDIDPRAVQVAQTAVIFRARRSCGRAPLPPPNVICARALPEDPSAWAAAQVGLSDDLRLLVDAMRAALRDAPLLGPLLKAEQLLALEIRRTVTLSDEADDNLFAAAGIAHDAFGTAERAVIAALQRAADSTSASPAERLLAADASDAVRFVEAVRNRYDAVLMNPPFGEPVASTKDYLRAAYPWIPTRDYNLLAAFVGRGLGLCKPEGYLGAITSRTGMFLKTFEAWRTEVFLGNRLVAVADLGSGVMEDALVEAATYVLAPAYDPGADPSVFVRLLKDADRPAALSAAVSADRRGEPDPRVFRVPIADFAAIPGSPVAYWMGAPIRRLFADLPELEGTGGEARVGVQTGDDFRFVRLFWEVNPRQIARNREDTRSGKGWVPFAKGGEYSPYWADIHLALEWRDDGEGVRNYPGARPQNTQYFFRAGLTWPERTTSGFGPRVLPAGSAFSHVGYGCFPFERPLAMLAYLNSRLVRALMDFLTSAGEGTSSGTAARHYLVGLVQVLPWPGIGVHASVLEGIVQDVIRTFQARDLHDETTRSFRQPLERWSETSVRRSSAAVMATRWKTWCEALDRVAEIESILGPLLGANEDAMSDLDAEALPIPSVYTSDFPEPVVRAKLIELARLPIDTLVDDVVEAAGGHRELATKSFYVDRRLELLSHFAKVRPSSLTDTLNSADALAPPEFADQTARDLISYMVGCAFGRWDVRLFCDDVPLEDDDPFAPVRLCPPAMLVGDNGWPSTVAAPGYPLQLPPDAVLLDQPGHSLDLPAAVEAAATAASEHGRELLGDAIEVLGRRGLRDYLVQSFFKEHLGRYSKSRRQAPVYWHLTIPSGTWSAWLYAPRFSREMLYSVVTLADHRLATAAEGIRTLQSDETASARQRAKAVDAERTLAAELQELRDDVARLAALGWQPDLNDGFVLCAAPLARWFPDNAWRQLRQQLDAIKRGDYPWASIHGYRTLL